MGGGKNPFEYKTRFRARGTINVVASGVLFVFLLAIEICSQSLLYAARHTVLSPPFVSVAYAKGGPKGNGGNDTGKWGNDKPDSGKWGNDKPDGGKWSNDKPDSGKWGNDKSDNDKPDGGKWGNDKSDNDRPDNDKWGNDKADKKDDDKWSDGKWLKEKRPPHGKRDRNRDRDRDDDPDPPPPRTVVEALQRLFKPPKPSVSADLANVWIGGNATNEILAINPKQQTLDLAKQHKIEVRPGTTLGAFDLSIVRLLPPPGMSAVTARGLLEQGPHGKLAPNYIYRPYRPQAGEGDVPRGDGMDGPCGAGRCYAREAIKWQPEMQKCARGARIGFIDTAIDMRHPVLAGRKISVGTFRRGEPVDADRTHGTSTLAILAGAPRSTVAGLLPEASYFVGDIFFADANGEPVADTVSLLQAVNWMSEWDVRVINMSIAGPKDDILRDAISGITRKGVVVLAAAGNEGPNSPPLYPAAYDEVIAVSAVASDLRSYRHANRGPHIDLVAPGVGIWTALPNGEGYQSGTSFAVPFVTAVVAAAIDHSRPVKKSALLDKVLTYKDLGVKGRDPIYGRGLVQAPAHCHQSTVPPVAVEANPQPHTSQASWETGTVLRVQRERPDEFRGATSFGFRD